MKIRKAIKIFKYFQWSDKWTNKEAIELSNKHGGYYVDTNDNTLIWEPDIMAIAVHDAQPLKITKYYRLVRAVLRIQKYNKNK